MWMPAIQLVQAVTSLCLSKALVSGGALSSGMHLEYVYAFAFFDHELAGKYYLVPTAMFWWTTSEGRL